MKHRLHARHATGSLSSSPSIRDRHRLSSKIRKNSVLSTRRVVQFSSLRLKMIYMIKNDVDMPRSDRQHASLGETRELSCRTPRLQGPLAPIPRRASDWHPRRNHVEFAGPGRGFVSSARGFRCADDPGAVHFLAFANEFFLTARNLLNVGRQASVVAIVALGQALVIIARGLDLSVGSVLGLSAVTAALGRAVDRQSRRGIDSWARDRRAVRD